VAEAAGVRALAFKSRERLEAENLVLRQQINILVRRLSKRVRLTNSDRLRLVWLYRGFPSILNAIGVIRLETLIRWQRRNDARTGGGSLAPAWDAHSSMVRFVT